MAISKAAKVANAGLVYVKMDSPSFESYLRNVVKRNDTITKRKALALLGKPAFDAEYKSQLQKQFSHDEGVIRTHLQEINSNKNIAAWNRFERHSAYSEKGKELPHLIDPAVDNLKLPGIGSHHKNNNHDGWDLQTYRDFASKAEKSNTSVKFSKQLMDDCFRAAVYRVKVATSYHKVTREKALKRCLGKESEDYWKDR